ncbi:15921_t:CDS:2, partial [Gigaspora margarita]
TLPSLPVVEYLESKNTFDKFEYKNEVLKETEGYFTEKTLKLPIQEPDFEDIFTKESLKKSLSNVLLNLKNKELASTKLLLKKIFSLEI